LLFGVTKSQDHVVVITIDHEYNGRGLPSSIHASWGFLQRLNNLYRVLGLVAVDRLVAYAAQPDAVTNMSAFFIRHRRDVPRFSGPCGAYVGGFPKCD
jgi:hypothetical protein